MTKFTCPKCEATSDMEVFASIPNEARLSFKLTPKPGERMTARAIGGSLDALDKLNRAIGKDMGVHTVTFVDRVEMNDGEITFHLIIMNMPRRRTTRATSAARQGEG